MNLSEIEVRPNVLKWHFVSPKLVTEAIRNNEGVLLHNLAFRVQTGHTGRSPHDRFIVDDEMTHNTVAWGDINRPIKKQHFEKLFEHAKSYLRAKEVYIQDVYCGADEHYRTPLRFIGTHAWQALFVRNMFLIPEHEKLEGFLPEWHVIAMPAAAVDEELEVECGLNSGDYIILNFSRRMVLIGGTGYAGEIKKSMLTVMNYILPERSVLPMHASVNVNQNDHVTIFFGLSGTGKTTLALDPECRLLGDDEHGWSKDGLFNLEGGCYAKTINLSREDEPLVYAATERGGTTVENVAYDPMTHVIDYDDGSYTENGRASFSIDAIPNAIQSGMTGHPDCIIFLTCDAFGVLPPVARLNRAQAAYHFCLGYTAKVAGTERGVKEPQPTYSALFGEPFFPRRHSVYVDMLIDRIREHSVPVWLVNTGWTGGPYGEGKRISIEYTRAIVRAVQDGQLDKVSMTRDEVFGFEVPTECPGVPSGVLDPRSTWHHTNEYELARLKLARRFIEKAQTLDLPESAKSGGPIAI
jgi:phosphoenolpyruvate carboxykinase (ATP)